MFLCILAVLLGIAVLMLLLGLFLLWVRVGVEAVGVNGEVSVELRYGALRIPVWPRPKHLRRPAPKPKEPAPAKPKKSKKNQNTAIPLTGRSWISVSLLHWRLPCWMKWRIRCASAAFVCAC